jgi:hypothetical protein
VTVHVQVGAVDSAIGAPAPPAAPTDWLVGAMEYVQLGASWLTVNV